MLLWRTKHLAVIRHLSGSQDPLKAKLIELSARHSNAQTEDDILRIASNYQELLQTVAGDAHPPHCRFELLGAFSGIYCSL